jgi:hypothetical protein
MTKGPVYEVPDLDPGKLRWKSGCLTLRGANDFRALICVQPASNSGFAQYWGSDCNVLVHSSLGFSGGLIVVSVPKGK